MSVLTNIANEIGRIQNAKSGIANAINAKGVTVPSTAKLGDYPGFINLISSSGDSGSSVPQGKVIGGFSNSSLNDVFNGETTLVYADLSAAEGVSNMAYTFSGCTNLVNVPIIPNSVTNMAYTFNGCASLVNAPIIPNSVTSMYYTFGGCVNLANAPAIPNSVTNMVFTFYRCNSLTNAPAIPNGVTNMTSTFYQCNNLANAPAIPNSVTNMANTFYLCNKLVNAPAIPNSVTYMFATFGSCVSLVDAPAIPSSVTYMGSTFGDCTSLVNAPVISNGVTYMGSTFYNCFNLVNAPVIPNSVTVMSSAFKNCSSLVNAPIIPNSVTDLIETFGNCANLVNAPIIPNSVTNICRTFNYCSNLITAPIIPSSVMNMDSTFYNCGSLTGDIYIESRNVTSCSLCFLATSAAKNVYVRGATFNTFNASYGAGENGVTLIHLYDWDKYSGSGVYTPYSETYDTSEIGAYNYNASSKFYNNRNSTNMSSRRNAGSTVYWSDSIAFNAVAGTFVLENTISVSFANSSNLSALCGKYFGSSANTPTIYYANANATYGRTNNTSVHGYYTYIIGERYYSNVSYTPASYSGTYIGSVNSADPAAYPAAGLQGGYYYVSLDT